MHAVDVVIVSHNSAGELRGAVEPLAQVPNASIFVVDNASTDDSLETLDGLDVTKVALGNNAGFAAGCNRGWRAGSAPFVLFLNPDARIRSDDLERLTTVLERDPAIGIAAPRIVDEDGELDPSIRRFPRLRSTYAQALFLHRVFSRAAWVDELVRDPSRYDEAGDAEWVSGACMLVRRDLLEQLGGWDEEFFLYCEDIDLCRRVWDAGFRVRFEPGARVVHVGGASAPRASLLPVLTASRIRYAQKHRSAATTVLERGGIALGALTHIIAGRGGMAARTGHVRSLRLATRGSARP